MRRHRCYSFSYSLEFLHRRNIFRCFSSRVKG